MRRRPRTLRSDEAGVPLPVRAFARRGGAEAGATRSLPSVSSSAPGPARRARLREALLGVCSPLVSAVRLRADLLGSSEGASTASGVSAVSGSGAGLLGCWPAEALVFFFRRFVPESIENTKKGLEEGEEEDEP